MKRILGLLLLLFTADIASAATICVTPASGCGSTQDTIQHAVNVAVQGDTIKLNAGHTYTESITLPNKGALTSFITITTDASSSDLPAANVRTSASYISFMPAIQSPGGGVSALYFAAGANHYKFQHVWFKNVPAGFGDIVAFGFTDSSQFLESQEPTDAIFDQIYMTGDSIAGQKRGFNVNGKRFTLTNSYIKDIKSVGQDSQCVGGGNGHGPITVINNYLECATENFIQGGFDPPIQTRMHVTGTPTTTRADVTVYQAGHTLAELHVGQFIAVQTVAGTPTYNSLQYTTISSITTITATTGTLTFPALTSAPIVGGDIRAQVIPDGITFQRNYVTKNVLWFDGALAAPTSPTTTGSTASGTLAAGQWCYKVQAFSLNGYQNNTINSALATPSSECATIAAIGKVTVAFTAVTGATSYRIWRGTSSGGENQWTSVTAVSTVDDGTLVWTTGTPSGATQITTKNLFEIKCAKNVQVDGNIFIHHRRGADIGYPVWIKTVDQDGTAWGCKTENVVMEKNIFADTNGLLEIHGQEASGNPFPGAVTNFTFRNNLAYGSTYANGGNIYAFNITQAADHVTIDHNTVVHITDGNGGGMMVVDSTQAHLTNFVFKNNMVRSETFGIHDPAGTGNAALVKAADASFSFLNNGVGGGAAPPYTSGNGNVYSSNATWQSAFTTYTADGSGGADYTISAGAGGDNYRLAGSDGKDIGADIALVTAATTGVAVGTGSVVAITSPVLPTGVRTIAYAAVETASGGTAPYTYAVTSGAAPAGLTLSSGGVWSGTPTTTASYTFTVTVTDFGSVTATQSYTVQILDPVTFSTTSPLPAGVINHVYSLTFAYSGGQAPFTCSSSGSLPTGLTLDTSTCVLAGTPTVAAVSTFSVTVTGALGSAATLASASLTVAGESLPAGRPQSVGPLTQELQSFRRATAPTNPADRLVKGDIWVDISQDPPKHNTYTVTGTWMLDDTGGALSGDGSALTGLNAAQLTTGTIPAAVFPADLNITSSITAPTVSATNVNVTGYIDLAPTTCNALSGAGHSRLCQDGTTNATLISQNGGAYAALGGGSGGGSSSTLPAITSVNNVTTTGNGVTGIVAKAGYFSGVNGNQTDTLLLAGASRGIYRICAVQNVTTAATVSSTMPALTIIWTNSAGSHSTTLLPANSGNTTASGEQACKEFSVSPGSQIHWDLGITTGAYASSGATALLFDFILTAEYIN